MSIDDWVKQSTRLLHEQGSESPRADAELLVQHVLGCSRTWLKTWGDQLLTEPQILSLGPILERRLAGEPIAYIVGERGFWSLMLSVSAVTLIPRPDTETLVEWALELSFASNARCLDLGTGTGAIALALASERPGWSVSGVDFSPEAVALAASNAVSNHLPQVTFSQSDWFDQISGQFELIVSNPPYIDPQDHHLDEGDVRFEPRSALVAAREGMADIELIVTQAPDYLVPGGWLLLEHGYQQGERVRECLKQAGFEQVGTRCDLAGQPRITGGRLGYAGS